jgi:hypothetical protein
MLGGKVLGDAAIVALGSGVVKVAFVVWWASSSGFLKFLKRS